MSLSVISIPSLTFKSLRRFSQPKWPSRRCHFHTFSRKSIVATMHGGLTPPSTEKRVSFVECLVLSFCVAQFEKFRTYKPSRSVAEHTGSLLRITMSILSVDQRPCRPPTFPRRDRDRMLHLSPGEYTTFDSSRITFSFVSVMVDTSTVPPPRMSSVLTSSAVKTFMLNS